MWHLLRHGAGWGMHVNKTVTLAAPAGASTTTEPAAEFINSEELRRRLPICRRTEKNHRDKGRLPFVQLGRRVIYHWPTVQQALLRQQRGGE